MELNIQKHNTSVQGGNTNFHKENDVIWETEEETDQRQAQLRVSGRLTVGPIRAPVLYIPKDRQNTYNATVRCVRAAILAVAKH